MQHLLLVIIVLGLILVGVLYGVTRQVQKESFVNTPSQTTGSPSLPNAKFYSLSDTTVDGYGVAHTILHTTYSTPVTYLGIDYTELDIQSSMVTFDDKLSIMKITVPIPVGNVALNVKYDLVLPPFLAKVFSVDKKNNIIVYWNNNKYTVLPKKSSAQIIPRSQESNTTNPTTTSASNVVVYGSDLLMTLTFTSSSLYQSIKKQIKSHNQLSVFPTSETHS